MGNMSYCRFENTAGDLEDCIEHINADLSESSSYERRARKHLIELCRTIAEEFEGVDLGNDLDGIA